MNETQFSIPSGDGKQVSCILSKGQGDRLVILSHGLTGGPFERMHFAARDYFMARDYDVLRFAYYSSEPGCRVLHESTLETHAMDLNAVLSHAKKTYGKIFICGHSYGGLTLLFANPHVTALSFWDAAYKPGWTAASERMDGKVYVTFSGKRTLIGAAMYEEAQRLLDSPDELKGKAAAIRTPSQIIIAGAHDKHETLSDLYRDLRCERSLETVDGADHNFYLGDTLERLLEKTEAWFAKFGAQEQRKAS